MKGTKILLVISVVALAVLALFSVRNFSHPSRTDKVAATIFPLYDITRNIAGKELEVIDILPPGSSPHTFDLTPKEAAALSGSRAVFAVGHGLDDWVSGLAASDVGRIVPVDKNIALRTSSDPDEPGQDPHYWLSAPNAILIARQIRDELSVLYPEKRDAFEKNYTAYRETLQALDAEIRGRLGTLSSRDIATFHGAWGYFADAYGLTVVATFEEFPGKDPTLQYLIAFQKTLKEKHIRIIFAEPQFSVTSLQPIAQDLGVTIAVLDPLGGVPGRESYEDLMRYNTEVIANTLQ